MKNICFTNKFYLKKIISLCVNLSIVVSSTIFAIFSFELILRITNINISRMVNIKYMNGLIVNSWPDFFTFLPNTSTTAISPTSEYSCKYIINKYGLRDRNHQIHKKENTIRLLLLGDSIGEGYGVEQNQMFSSLIEYWSTDYFEIINASIRNSCQTEYYYKIGKYINIYKNIDRVILIFFDNDFLDNINYEKYYDLKVSNNDYRISRSNINKSLKSFNRFLTYDSLLYSMRTFSIILPMLVEIKEEEHYFMKLDKFIGNQIIDIYKRREIKLDIKEEKDYLTITFLDISKKILNDDDISELWNKYMHYSNFYERINKNDRLNFPDDVINKTIQYLNCCKNICGENKIPLSILYIPSLGRINEDIDTFLCDWAKLNNIHFVSTKNKIISEILLNNKTLYYPFDKHLTKFGHELVGNILFNDLLDLYTSDH